VAFSDIKKFDFVVEGAEAIARSISRWTILEDIYLYSRALITKSTEALEDSLSRLYASIFIYLARAKQYFEQSTTSLFAIKCVHK